MLPILWLPKWGLNLIGLLKKVFHLCIHGHLELCLHEQTHIIIANYLAKRLLVTHSTSNTASRAGSQQSLSYIVS